MLEIGIVTDGVLYAFSNVSWISIEHRDRVKIAAEDGCIVISEDKDGTDNKRTDKRNKALDAPR